MPSDKLQVMEVKSKACGQRLSSVLRVTEEKQFMVELPASFFFLHTIVLTKNGCVLN